MPDKGVVLHMQGAKSHRMIKCCSHFAPLSYSTLHNHTNWQQFSSRLNLPFEHSTIIAIASSLLKLKNMFLKLANVQIAY